jgi:hypothetical protein
VRRFVALLFLALAAAVLAGPGAAAPQVKKLHVVITGQSHHPVVGKTWHYEVKVTDAAGKPVACKIHLQFLFGSVPVGQIGTHVVKNGVWTETFGTPGHPPFPATARGQPLVIQAIVTAKGYATAKAVWPIVVK